MPLPKFDRVATEQIVRAIESHLKDDQIVGDIRETERDKRKAESAATAAGQSTPPQPEAQTQPAAEAQPVASSED